MAKRDELFTPIRHEKILREVLAQIKEGIATGKLGKGDRLPPERQLEEILGVSRATIREAIKSLEMMGLVECVQGDGNFIAKNLDHALTEPLTIMFMLEGGTLRQVQQLRRAMELSTAELAAVESSSELLEELEQICAALESGLPEKDLAELDRRFHFLIAKAAGNPLVLSMLHASESLIAGQIKGVRDKMLEEPYNLEQINGQHRDILQALKSREPQAAQAAMVRHMAFIEEYLMRE